MKTLVIHPKDLTTDFLSPIYADRDWTVIRTDMSKGQLSSAIKSHDRIVMLGHGTEQGLLGFKKFFINSSIVYLLRQKECVCIWCNADKFVEQYGLKGFYTGMIISEYEEAVLYAVSHSDGDVEESNLLFAKSIKDAISKDDMLAEAKTLYTSESNRIILFNKENLYSRCQQ